MRWLIVFRNILVFLSVCLFLVIGLGKAWDADRSCWQLRLFQLSATTSTGPAATASSDETDLILRVNQVFKELWDAHNLQPADQADSLLMMRRISLALTGSIPSLQEIRQFHQDDPTPTIATYVDHLLSDRRSADYLAERLARSFVGVEDGPFIVFRRHRFVDWLSQRLNRNQGYDQIVHQMLTATGLWTDNPAVNFFTRSIIPDSESGSPDPIEVAGRVSRSLLGMSIDCLQCHDDFLGTIDLGSLEDPVGGTQLDFHGLAAYFNQVENSLLGLNDNRSAPSYHVQLVGQTEETQVAPQVPYLRELIADTVNHSSDRQSASINQRQQFADWIIHPQNRPFSRAIVNRIWGIMFGQPLVDPINDIPLAASIPPVMELLVDDFIHHGYDLHRLIRVIAHLEPYRLQSGTKREITSIDQRQWAVFPVTRLRPEQVATSLFQSTKLMTVDNSSHIITRLTSFDRKSNFIQRFGDLGEDEFSDRSETVSQRLLMLNGDVIRELIQEDFSIANRLHRLAPDQVTGLDIAFLTTLTRYPSLAEKEYLKEFLWQHPQPHQPKLANLGRESGSLSSTGEPAMNPIMFHDLYWVLVNSAEFRWNH